MKRFIFIVCTLLVIGNLVAQPAYEDRKRDSNFLVGYQGGVCNGQPADFGITKFSFNDNQLSITEETSCANMFDTNASISDTTGQLLFYTDGIYVYDRLHNNMMSLNNTQTYPDTTLNPGYEATQRRNDGYPLVQGAIILPNPTNKEQYYIIHMSFSNHSASPFVWGDMLYYTLIDMSLNNGLGGIVSMNTPLLEANFCVGLITACRHANGRDWWFGCWSYDRLRYYSFLLDTKGIHTQSIQNFTGSFVSSLGTARFSPDGNKYVIFTANTFTQGFLSLYDFDRCSGQLSQIFHQDSFPIQGYGHGVEFSNNSRYCYIADDLNIWQYDTHALDFGDSKTNVATYDGFKDAGIWETSFSTLFKGGDNKIYSGSSSTRYLHVINSPDSAGAACNIVQRQVYINRWINKAIPNFPNFRLGALTGSACDTLDFNVAVTPIPSRDNGAGISALVYPNPTASNLTIAYALPEQGDVSVVSALGQVLYEKVLAKGDDKLWLNVEDWVNGVYFVRLSTPNSGVYSKKVFVLH